MKFDVRHPISFNAVDYIGPFCEPDEDWEPMSEEELKELVLTIHRIRLLLVLLLILGKKEERIKGNGRN